MAVRCITSVLLIITTTLTTCNGLECSYTGQALSSCPPGRNITLFDHDISFTMVWHNDESRKINGSCFNLAACEGPNHNLQKECNALNANYKTYQVFFSCLKEYCNVMPTHGRFLLCTHQHSGSAIKILCKNRLSNPSCFINLGETGSGQKGLDFNCSWHQEYFGVNATLQISHSSGDLKQHCSKGESSIRAGPFSPNIFLNRSSRKNAFCNISIPNVRHKPFCNFSLYITPWNTSMNVGESINLTCPQGVTWWEIKMKDIISLKSNMTAVSPKTVTFHAKTPNENGLIIMCMNATSTDKEQVLGIGKIVVKETSSTTDTSSSSNTEHPTTTVFSNTTQAWISDSQDDENNVATVYSMIVSDNSTGSNLLVMTSDRLVTEDDGLIIPLSVAASIALLFSIGICVLFIICRSRKKKGGRRHNKYEHCKYENRKMGVRYETSNQNASQDLSWSSESIQFLEVTEGKFGSTEQPPIAGNQTDMDSAEHAYQGIADDLAPQRFKEESSVGQDYYGVQEQETPTYSSMSQHSIYPYEGMYYTLEDPKEKTLSMRNNTCSQKASEDSQMHASESKISSPWDKHQQHIMDDRSDFHTDCKNTSTDEDGEYNSVGKSSIDHHIANSSENMYFTLEDPREKQAPTTDKASNMTLSGVAHSDVSECKQYENMDLDDLHLYAAVSKPSNTPFISPNAQSLRTELHFQFIRFAAATLLFAFTPSVGFPHFGECGLKNGAR